ncbi:hypothetical protein [Metallibacterium sp.]
MRAHDKPGTRGARFAYDSASNPDKPDNLPQFAGHILVPQANCLEALRRDVQALKMRA